MKLAVIYWSGTGNTEAMAECVAAGAKAAGAEAEIFRTDEFSVEKINGYDGFALGCPAMGAEELEESEFAPLYEQLKPGLAGKKVVLFGSYGWGDGEWMRSWQEDCQQAGILIAAESVIVMGEPDEAAKAECEKLGQAVLG